MTDNTYGYGRAGGPAVQNVREFMDIQVSSATTTAQETTNILQDASATTGDATSYYLVWGYTVGHTDAAVAYGYLESNEGTPENIAPFVATIHNTQVDDFQIPIKIAAGQGVDVRTLNNPNGTVLAAIKFTVVTP